MECRCAQIPETVRLPVEAPPISVPDPDATPMQLEESEETRRPKHRALPTNVSKEEFDAHQLTHLPFRSWCDHCVRGKAVDDAHRPRIDPHRGEAKMGMDHFFLARATDPQHAKAILNCLDFQSEALLSHGGERRWSGCVGGGTRGNEVHGQDSADHHERSGECGQEPRGHDQGQQNARNCCDQHTEGIECKCRGIERANYEVEKQIRTLRSRFEENYGESVGLDHKMLPFLVRHCAWLITHYQVKSDGKTPYERLRGRPYQGQVAEFAEVVHFRDPGKAADMPKLDDRWNLGLWLGKSLASDEHYVGTSAGVRRCRSIWRRPEKQRWDRKMLTEMNGEPWNPTAHHQDKPPQVRGVYITLERQIKYGERKVVRHASGMQKVHSPRMQGTIPGHCGQ